MNYRFNCTIFSDKNQLSIYQNQNERFETFCNKLPNLRFCALSNEKNAEKNVPIHLQFARGDGIMM